MLDNFVIYLFILFIRNTNNTHHCCCLIINIITIVLMLNLQSKHDPICSRNCRDASVEARFPVPVFVYSNFILASMGFLWVLKATLAVMVLEQVTILRDGVNSTTPLNPTNNVSFISLDGT